MRAPNIYVASSWRNERQPHIVQLLVASGYPVYDFRHPTAKGFSWSDVDPNWREWTPAEYQKAMASSQIVKDGFFCDMTALRKCDGVVMVQPCGVSAALELGWAAGSGKPTFVLLPTGEEDRKQEPDLMFGMATKLCLNEYELLRDMRLHFEREYVSHE